MEESQLLCSICQMQFGSSFSDQMFMYFSYIAQVRPVYKESDHSAAACDMVVFIQICDPYKKSIYIVSHIFQYLRYLLCILRSKAFICIKKGDPVSFCLVNGKIFCSSKIIDPWKEKYLCPHFPGYLHGTITASCIYYDLFTHDILPPGKGTADIFFFIFHDHTLRYGFFHHRLPSF